MPRDQDQKIRHEGTKNTKKRKPDEACCCLRFFLRGLRAFVADLLILILAGPQARNLLLRRFAKLDAYE